MIYNVPSGNQQIIPGLWSSFPGKPYLQNLFERHEPQKGAKANWNDSFNNSIATYCTIN